MSEFTDNNNIDNENDNNNDAIKMNAINSPNTIDKYNYKLSEYAKAFSSNYVMFDVNKACGYSAFIPCFKKGTLRDVYYAVQHFFENANFTLYIYNKDIDWRQQLPNDESITIQEYIHILPNFFKPAYPMPAQVVYSIYLVEST
jgi:hypothetical protein